MLIDITLKRAKKPISSGHYHKMSMEILTRPLFCRLPRCMDWSVQTAAVQQLHLIKVMDMHAIGVLGVGGDAVGANLFSYKLALLKRVSWPFCFSLTLCIKQGEPTTII
jgi:hypothetical protein